MKFKKLISILLSFALIIICNACGYTISEISSADTSSTLSSSSSTIDKRTGYDIDTVDADLATNDDVTNILIIGQDRRANGAARLRSDCCMIVSFNEISKEISLISLMRDQYVKDPRYDPDNPQDDVEEYFPINYSYLCGDSNDIFGLIDETIEYNYDVKIDYNMEVDFFRFIDVFNKIGPIKVKLSQAEADYLNSSDRAKNHAAAVGVDNSTWNLTAGINELDAAQLLTYCRTRYIPYGDEVQDFGRTTRQRNVVQTVYDTLSSESLDEILSLISDVKQYITTDMNLAQMGALAYKLWKNGYSSNFNSYRIPVDGTYNQEVIRSNVYGVGTDLHLITIDAEANAEYLNDYIYGSSEESTDEDSE